MYALVRRFLKLCFALAVATAGMVFAPVAIGAGPNYWIDESTDFTGNSCENDDLNDVTSSLRSRLDADGWTGTRWTNANAWPEDFIERDLGGIDDVAGDSATLSIYAGHGNRASIQFGFRRGGRCTVSFPALMRLGTQGGDKAAYAMWVTSCTVNLDSLSRHFDQAIRQTFGYHNSPAVKDDQPRDFYEETDDLRNSRAWIEEMEDRAGWFTGDNSPIALTFGLSQSHCFWVQDTAKLRARVLLSDAPAPDTWYCYTMFDHGGC
jgi:hypothetical protein